MNEDLTQYNKFKEKYPDAVLLFRNGDYYVCFESDSEIVDKVLEFKGGLMYDNTVRVTRFAANRIDVNLPKLVRAGFRVAICDTIETPEDYIIAKKAEDASKKAHKKEMRELDEVLGGRLTALVDKLKATQSAPIQQIQLQLF